FASRDDGLRMLPLSAEEAAYWNAWLARLSGFIGYGILFIVPMVNASVSPAVGRLVALVVMLLAFLYALAIILQNKASVSQQIELRATQSELAFNRLLLGMFAKSWYVVAIVYFAALALVTVVRPEDALPFKLAASLQTLLAIGIGMFLSVVLSQLISRGFHVPEETRARFPMLENRLNSFLPTIMKVARLIILFVVVGFVADAWGLFNLAQWIASETGVRTLGTVVSVSFIVIMAMLVWIGLASWIEQRLNPQGEANGPSAREKTLLTIFRNAVAITIIVMTLMIVLAEIGINIGPLIAGAGVLGLAIGFGAQKLVQDIITGVFIQLENAINSGDVVTAGGVTGTAEKLSIRSLGIRDLSGTYHLIPFSSVDTVANYMREFAYHVGEYGVAYREDIDEVIVKLREAFDELVADPDHKANIIAELEVHGVTALADSAVNIRVRIKTLPGAQWGVGRAYNRLVKYRLDAAGIEIPFPHMTMYFGQDKEGKAPPAPVIIESAAAAPAAQIEDKKAAATRTGTKKTTKTTKKGAKTNAKTGDDYDDDDD
ncbi:MAG: mechanosensitive ion channel domain-containing protein, partial [Pseudohongiella sp.]